MTRSALAFSLLALCVSTSCAERNRGPEIASSAGDASYAERLPDELVASNERYDREASAVTEIGQRLPEFPAALDKPDWAIVLDVYQRADAEGRSNAYAAHQREEAILGRFHEQERKPLVRRVAASNEYVAKEKGCDVQLWGATDRGLEKGIEERLEARRRGDSEAHAVISREVEALGEGNEKTLRDQVDQIRFASYVVHVGLLLEEDAMRQQADEAAAARSALEDHIDQLKKRENPDPEAIGRAELALRNLDPAVQKAKQRLEQAEQRRDDLRKKYEASFEQLTETVEVATDAQEKEREAAE